MHKEQSQISCPTFNKQEPAIRHMTEEINKACGPQEKSWWAEELLKEIKILLECPQYDGAKLDCANCRTISELRSRPAGLILKARKLM